MTKAAWDSLTPQEQEAEAKRVLHQLLHDAMAGVNIQADDYVVPDGPLITFIKKPESGAGRLG